MPTINQLPVLSQLSSGDQIPVYNTANGDARRASITILPPCINRSAADFTVVDGPENTLDVRYALAGLKGVGLKAMEALAAERDGKGPFKDLADFARRVDPRGLNKRQLESLIASGGFDALHPNRAGVHARLPPPPPPP